MFYMSMNINKPLKRLDEDEVSLDLRLNLLLLGSSLLGSRLLCSLLGNRLLGSFLSSRLLGSLFGSRLLCSLLGGLLWLLGSLLWLLSSRLLLDNLLCLGLLGLSS